MRPQLGTTQTEVRVRIRLIPKHLVLQLVGLGVVVNHQTLKVFRALVHDLTERVKVREHAGILLIELPPVAHDVLAEDEHVVNVRAQRRWDTHRILHRNDEHGVDVATVHEQIAHIAIADPALIIQTVVQNQKVPWVHGGGAAIRQILGDLFADQLLALHHVSDDQRRILLVDEDRRHDFTIELVGTLCARNHGAKRNALVMPEEIFDQERLAGLALANEHNHLVVFDLGHIKLLQTEVESSRSGATGTTCC